MKVSMSIHPPLPVSGFAEAMRRVPHHIDIEDHVGAAMLRGAVERYMVDKPPGMHTFDGLLIVKAGREDLHLTESGDTIVVHAGKLFMRFDGCAVDHVKSVVDATYPKALWSDADDTVRTPPERPADKVL